MQQHAVPQNVTSFEFKIVGFLTLKQFAMLGVCSVLAFISFTTINNFYLKIIVTFFFIALGLLLTFGSVQQIPFYRWILIFVKAIFSPTQRIWIKTATAPVYLTTSYAVDAPPASKVIEDRTVLSSYLQTLPTQKKTSLDVLEQQRLQSLALNQTGKMSQIVTPNFHTNTPSFTQPTTKPSGPIIAQPTAPPPVKSEQTIHIRNEHQLPSKQANLSQGTNNISTPPIPIPKPPATSQTTLPPIPTPPINNQKPAEKNLPKADVKPESTPTVTSPFTVSPPVNPKPSPLTQTPLPEPNKTPVSPLPPIQAKPEQTPANPPQIPSKNTPIQPIPSVQQASSPVIPKLQSTPPITTSSPQPPTTQPTVANQLPSINVPLQPQDQIDKSPKPTNETVLSPKPAPATATPSSAPTPSSGPTSPITNQPTPAKSPSPPPNTTSQPTPKLWSTIHGIEREFLQELNDIRAQEVKEKDELKKRLEELEKKQQEIEKQREEELKVKLQKEFEQKQLELAKQKEEEIKARLQKEWEEQQKTLITQKTEEEIKKEEELKKQAEELAASKDAEIKKLQEMFDKQKAEIEAKQLEKTAEEESFLRDMQVKLDEEKIKREQFEKNAAELNVQLKALFEEKTTLETQLKEKPEQEKLNLEENVKLKEQIEQLNSQITSLNSEISNKSSEEIKRQNEEEEKLKTQLEEQRKSLDEQKMQLDIDRKQLENEKEAIKKQNEEIEAQRKQLEEMQKKLDEQQKKIQEAQNAQKAQPAKNSLEDLAAQLQKETEKLTKKPEGAIRSENLIIPKPDKPAEPKIPTPPPTSAPKAKPPKIITQLETANIPPITNLVNVINGVVYDSNGNLVPNVIIIVKDTEKTPVRALKSNRLGQFAISTPLPNGIYTMEFEDSKEEHFFDIFQITLTGAVVPPVAIKERA